MKISEYAVKNYQFTLVLFIMVIVLGITTVFTMPRSEDPELAAPTFPVIILYPGTSPQDMEELVVEPLEKEISGLDDIKWVRSTIRDGLAVLRVDYTYNSDVDAKYQEIVRVINSKRSELPKDILSIEVQKWQPSDVNIMQIALVSENAPRKQLQFQAERLQQELEKINQLKNVEIHGLPERQVRIELATDRLARMHIPLNAIIASLQSEMANIPGGSVDAVGKAFSIKTSGNYNSIEEIQNTIVYSANRKNILLKDVATVYYGYENDTYHTRLNGHRCVFVTAAQKDGKNITQTQKAYLPVIASFKKTLPQNIDLIQSFDQADNVNKRLSGLGTDFIIAILLVAVTLMPLGARPALIVMISIPLSLAIGIVLLNLLGYNLNQLSIVGLVIALGLLVDDSIVVVENIERWMLQGYTRTEATLKATKQIGLAVVGCTATLIIAFMPLVFLPEGSGDFIRGLPLAVILSVLASMVVSLTIIPFLSGRILKEHPGNAEANFFMRALKKLIHGSYSKLLEHALNKPWQTVLTAVCIFAGSVFLLNKLGYSLFPASEKPQFLVNITAPPQANLAYTDAVSGKVEKELLQMKSVKFVSANIGKGNPRIYYNESPVSERSDFAQLFVQLDSHTSPGEKLAIIDQLRHKWTPYPGAKVEVKNFEQGPPVVAPVEVRIFGDNLDTLRSVACKVEGLLKETAGTMYVNNPVRMLKSDIRIHIDKQKAQILAVPTINIARTVRMAVAGLNIGKYSDINGNDYNILLTRIKNGRPAIQDLDNLYVNANNGIAIPLNNIATIGFQTSPLMINHNEKRRVVSVKAFVQKGYLADRVINDIIGKMDQFRFPPGYSYQMGGEVEARNESFGGVTKTILIAAFLFIAVLVLEFKTFKSTLIVLSVIPLGIVGAAIALWLTGNSLSFVAIIGLVALAGIEVKNTILLVDFTNQLRLQGKPLDEAIREAGEIRFLPIVLTSMTAIGGLMPIAVSTNPLTSPLAIVLIGGLVSSTLLSRIVTPVVYKLLPPKIT